MATTDSEHLAEVNAAITRILTGGQDVSISDKRITNPNLKNLFATRAYLEAKIAFAAATGPARNTGLIRR